MVGRSRSPAEQAGHALGGTLGDVTGAAAEALGALGTKAAGAAQSVMSSNGDAKGKARKARKTTGKASSQAAETAGKKADGESKAGPGDRLLQLLGRRTDGSPQTATGGGWNIEVDVNDVPRLLRGTALVATGLGTIFAPGSALDVSKHVDGDMDQLAEQARQGIDTAANVTQQRIKDVIDLAKDALVTFSEALQEGMASAESQTQQALEESQARLAQATEQTGDAAQQALPRKKGGSLRWLFYGLLLGGLAAFLSSPFSGPIGERLMNLRRDLGLGGAGSSESQYWPSQPQQNAAGTPGAPSSPQASADAGKTESWSQSSDVKESPDKS
jgi:hypothetical protein